jgi:hypothetical protein
MEDEQEDKTFFLLAKAAEKILGKSFDLQKSEDIDALRDLARKIVSEPDSDEPGQILELMDDLDPDQSETLHITPGIGVQRVQLFIPEEKRSLKRRS